jgi:cell division protein FtsW
MEQNVSKSSFYFVGSLSAIVLVGVIMVYSSSYIYAKEVIGSSGHFFFKQLIFLLMGISLALVTSKTKISFWYKFAYYLHIIFVGFLLLTLIKPFAETINGSTRWVSLGLFKFQPGEFVKISTLLVATSFFNEFEKLTNKERVQKSAMLLAPLGIFAIQPDFGSLFICTAIIGFSCFMSSFPRRYFYGLTLLATGLLTLLVFVERYRVKRLLTFLDPWSSPKGSGFQIIQSYLAFANGSFWGQGLGNSHEKLFYLPEAYNDFIFSVIGEELGFFWSLLYHSSFYCVYL